MQSDPVRNSVNTVSPTTDSLWYAAQTLGYPAALWRLPNQTEKQFIISTDERLPRVTADLEELPAGFVFSPFDNLNSETSAPAQTLFLRADLQASFSATGVTSLTISSDFLAEQIQQLVRRSNKSAANYDQPATVSADLTDPDEQTRYLRNVTAAIEAMQRGEFRKVVLSRTKRVRFDQIPRVTSLFDKLCARYPTAFVSAVYLPETNQVWLSATPERLVSVDQDGIFRTVSLAGTQSAYEPDGTPKRPSEAMWSQKEIEEQALVNRYIIECFKKIRLREYVEEGPKTIIAGNLMHLCTSFTVDTQQVCYPQLGTVMLRLLHPTSAVCGMPRDQAFAFIQQHEVHDREFYAGFLGPVNVSQPEQGPGPASNLFVHLRCMKLEGDTATLYAGAGITEDSNPEREWQETEMKCQTVLAVLN
ncbi:isochorismate synthase [Spirosoma sp. KUDC1026]|uniref:isochorismate synthase n=1 Tax=Spirosoma sp. KUDC1026 TaxID=2745947 RepID=UPI00159BCF71|nr:isochorismate synthase [Spirosoma sp. KUDC1026]QKZ14641.1 isochorismate synthase [Spirosoma sp. KUDC1026]